MAKRSSSPQAMQIGPNKSYIVTFHTEHGDFVVDIFAKQASTTVNDFVLLARA